jgi:hypothetical protein
MEEGGPPSLLAMRKKQGPLWGGERGNGSGVEERREIKTREGRQHKKIIEQMLIRFTSLISFIFPRLFFSFS